MDVGTLLSGPRGRRVLLAYALASQRIAFPGDDGWHIHRAVGETAYGLSPPKGTSHVRLGIDGEMIDGDASSPQEIAHLLNEVPLAEPTHELLRNVLHQSVISARYYQEPDGEDVLLDTAPMRNALYRVAGHLVESSLIDWWDSPWDATRQAWIWWDGHEPNLKDLGPAAIQRWRAETIASNERALRDRPVDPWSNYSGIWWSSPAMAAIATTRELFDGTPAGLWFTEDSGYDTARSVHSQPPADASVLEIRSADDWAELCWNFPLDVSAEKRHDWYRASGRVGAWVIPDWTTIADNWDGLHLTVAGYLAASGVVIPVRGDTASFIAGWSPDETWWFVAPAQVSEVRCWDFLNTWEGDNWVESPRTS